MRSPCYSGKENANLHPDSHRPLVTNPKSSLVMCPDEKDPSAGMVRKSSGNLHFYINGLDQGVAATRVPQQMWGVVDLYGMTVKVRTCALC